MPFANQIELWNKKNLSKTVRFGQLSAAHPVGTLTLSNSSSGMVHRTLARQQEHLWGTYRIYKIMKRPKCSCTSHVGHVLVFSPQNSLCDVLMDHSWSSMFFKKRNLSQRGGSYFCHLRATLIFEPTCATRTVGSYASLSVCLSVCLDLTKNQTGK